MTLEELTEILARVDGRERQIVEAYLVRLRAARIIGTREAFGPMDMACALIGLNAAHRAAEAPDAVRTFRGLRARLMTGIDSERYLPDQVIEARDFAETLAAIIETAPEIERAFETIIFETLANDPGASLGAGGARVAMLLTAQIHTGTYPAAAIRVETNLARKWGYGRKQRALEGVFELVFVGDDAVTRLDEQIPKRRLSVALQLPVFLALHEAFRACTAAACGELYASRNAGSLVNSPLSAG
jgi:hypothetical protein